MKNLFLSILTLSFLTALSQDTFVNDHTAPNQEQIKIATHDTSSQFFYSKLFERYHKGDTTLNLADYRHLYYGYIYQDNYRPLESMNYTDSITNTLAPSIRDSSINPLVYDKLERYINKALIVEPFNMNYINFMIYIKSSINDIETAKIYSYKLKMIKETIFSSGTGLTKKSPWHVIYIKAEQDILNSLGVRYSKPIMVSRQIEYFHLPIRNNGNRGYYFDIGRVYLKQPKSDIRRPEKRFEINPLNNPKSSRHIKYEEY